MSMFAIMAVLSDEEIRMLLEAFPEDKVVGWGKMNGLAGETAKEVIRNALSNRGRFILMANRVLVECHPET